jgi:hypothetical protein
MTLLVSLAIVVVAVAWRWEAVMHGAMATYDQVGLALFLLAPLTIVLLATIVHAWFSGEWGGETQDTVFDIVSVLGPMTGFLGTTLGLMQAMNSLGGARNLDALLEMVGSTFEGMGVAFSTTVWGLTLAIVAIFLKRISQRKQGDTQ